jgi:PAS domain S-box-containing protein
LITAAARDTDPLRHSGNVHRQTNARRIASSNGHQFDDAIAHVLRDNSSCIFEYSLELAGRQRFFKATLLPTPPQNGDGQLDHPSIAVVVRDVTAQQEAQRELLEKQELYQHLFDANPQPLWVYDTETLHIVAVNDAALHQYGYSREEFLNLAMSDLYLAGDQSRATTANTAFNPDGAWQHSKRDGSVFYAEVTSHELSFNGRCARLVLAHDVTERIETEAALQAAEAKYRSIFENAIEGIFQTTPAGIYLTANPMLARLYGYNSPDELTNSVTDIGQQITSSRAVATNSRAACNRMVMSKISNPLFAAVMDKSSGFRKMRAPSRRERHCSRL